MAWGRRNGRGQILIEDAKPRECSGRGESRVALAFPRVLKASLVEIEWTWSDVDSAQLPVQGCWQATAEGCLPKQAGREFIEIGNKDSIRAVPLRRGVERGQRSAAVKTPLGAGGMQLETIDQAGIGEFQSVELPWIGAMGKNDLSVSVQQRAG